MKILKSLLKSLFGSKKVRALLAGWAVILAAKLGLDLSPTDVAEMLGVLVAYILGQGWADSGKEAAKIEAFASSKPVK